MIKETKIVGLDGALLTTIFFDVKLNVGDKTNPKYHGGVEGDVEAVNVIGETKYVMVS